MADPNQRISSNVPGPYYVDETCIDCDMCRNHAPQFLRRDDQIGLTYVYRQPMTVEEAAAFEKAREICPTDSIGREGG